MKDFATANEDFREMAKNILDISQENFDFAIRAGKEELLDIIKEKNNG